MQILLNKKEIHVPDRISLADLLRDQGIDPAQKGVAAAVNAEVIPRQNWGTTSLCPQDRVDIIHAVQGG